MSRFGIRRLRVVGIAAGVAVLALGMTARPAQADPHGVFFTVVGQQQIFFNILAALNQADYVEPLQLRQQLAQGRDAAGYVPSASRPLAETATQLADVLTRSVSLEGQDVRTQERSDEYAREVVRQQRVAELIKQLCQEAFGAKDCTGDVEPQPIGKNKFAPLTGKEQSFIQDPVVRSKLPFVLGAIGALSSGTQAHANFANTLIEEANRGGAVLPFAYSPEVAAWRAAAKGNPESEKAVAGLDNALISAASTYLDGGLDPRFWDDVRLDSNGKAEINYGSDTFNKSTTPVTSALKSLRTFNTLVRVPQSFGRIAQKAVREVDLQLNSTVVDGAVPDLAYKIGANGKEDPTNLSTIVTSPANVKVGLQQQLLTLLAQLEGDPTFADPTQIGNDVGESAVDRDGKNALKIGTPLEPLQKSDVIEEGLLPNSGVVARTGLGRPFLEKFLKGCLEGLCKDLNSGHPVEAP